MAITNAVAQTGPDQAGDVPMHVVTSIVRDIVCSFKNLVAQDGV